MFEDKTKKELFELREKIKLQIDILDIRIKRLTQKKKKKGTVTSGGKNQNKKTNRFSLVKSF